MSAIADTIENTERKATRRPLTDAEIAARRANAQHSTGPRTVEGKLVTRGNALKHGLASAEPVVLPPELAAEVEATVDQFTRALHPANAAEARQVRKAAIAAVRHERLALLELTAAHARSARAVADRRAAIDATVAAALAQLEPTPANRPLHAAALDTLARSAAGCAAVAARWSDLLAALDEPDAWREQGDARRAAVLLGCPDVRETPDRCAPAWRRFWSDVSWAAAEPSPAGARVDADEADRRAGRIAAARDRLRGLGQAERVRWHERADDLAANVEPVEVAAAPILAGFDPSPEGARLARYLAEADRAERSALVALDRLRRLPTPLSSGFDAPARNKAGAAQASDGRSFAEVLEDTFRAGGIWSDDEPAATPTADPAPDAPQNIAPPRNEPEATQDAFEDDLASSKDVPSRRSRPVSSGPAKWVPFVRGA